MKHCKSVLSVIVVIALIVSTIMIGNTGPFAEGGDQGYPVPELFPEVNRFMDEDEKKTIVSRIDGYGDALNTILYKTVSGEVMGIFYPLDVKYLDGDYVKDKSNKLYESESNSFVYETRDNNILSFFPDNIADGIVTRYGDVSVSVAPINGHTDSAYLGENNTVIYRDVFGSGSEIRYNPSFAGIKDVLVLSTIPESNVFEYIVKIENASVNETGTVITGDKVIADFGQIDVEDSFGRTAIGEISFAESQVTGEYIMTVIVPRDFLEDEATEYPVFIDPTLYFYTSQDYYGNNQYATSYMNSNGCSIGGTLYQNANLYTGYSSYTYRSLLKFPGLSNIYSSIKNSISYAGITLYRSSTYSGASDIYVQAYPESYSWTQNHAYSATLYSNRFNGYVNASYVNANGNTVTSVGTSKIRTGAAANGSNTINLTNVINYSGFSPSKGILIKLSDETQYVSFYGSSTQYSSYIPRLSVTFSGNSLSTIKPDRLYNLFPYKTDDTVSDYLMTYAPALCKDSSSYGSADFLSGNTSYVSLLAPAFRFIYTGYGYLIQRTSDNYYLKCVNSSSLTFVSNDDTVNYTTRWFISKSGSAYYITHYFSNFLSAYNLDTSSPSLTVQNYTSGFGVKWYLKEYSFDINYAPQVDHSACGAASSLMLLDWLGIDISGYTDTSFKNYAQSFYYGNNGIGAENYQLAILKTIYDETGDDMYGEIPAGWVEGDSLLNSTNTQYVFIKHENNPLVIANGGNLSAADTEDEFYRIIMLNIAAGHPVIIHITVATNDSYFNYTSNGHYVLVTGIYTNSDGNRRLVIADPHYNAVASGSSQTYAMLDIPFSSYYYTYKHSSAVIRNELW